MVTLESISPAILDRAEGSPQTVGEEFSTVRTATMPAIRISAETSAPTAETGIIAAVVTGGEGQDSDKKDAQDASRTTAETQVTPATEEVAQPRVPSILIIEDSAELAEIIEATLQRIHFRTAHETHGTRALTRFNEMKPDVVLLDIGLPDMTGWKLLDHIKEVKGDARMPAIIVITAYGDPANRLVGKLQNVHEYLIKPFTSDEVERVVMSAVSGAAQ